MKKKKGILKSKKKLTSVIVTSLLVLVAALGFLMPNNFKSILNSARSVFAAGDEPVINKARTNNGDGTYKLSLSVKGDSEKVVPKANVIVIVDRSGSMDSQSGTGAYVATNSTGNNLYGFIDGEYVPLERRGTSGNRTFWYNGVQYTGQRYQYDSTATRMQATQAAVNGLASSLLAHNGGDNPDDTIEMALVSFATNAQTNVANTTSVSTFTTAVNGLDADGGTNWEAALQQANGINFGDDDPTYVIFFSDGSPTFHSTNGGYNNWNNTYRVYGSGQEQEPNMERSYTQAVDDATTLANKFGKENFYTIFAYGTNVGAGYMSDLTAAAGAPAGNNYSASNTAELQDAFDEILENIELAGIGDAVINDGTTNQVSTTTGVVELLEVDETSYKYWKTNPETGELEEWTDPENDDELAAHLVNGAVEWDLSKLGVLENNVTYKVTFDVYPSQTTYDYIADLENGTISYSDLPAGVRKYLHQTGTLGNYSYTLDTNTENVTLTYDDTRDEAGPQTIDFNTLEAVETTAEPISIKKTFKNELDPSAHGATAVTVNLNRDGEEFYNIELNSSNSWEKDPIYIATGLARLDKDNNVFTVLDEGHDYTFSELGSEQFNWEMHTDTVHPMLINGELKELIMLEDDDDQPAMGDANYKEVGGVEYVKLDNNKIYRISNTSPKISAVNERRSRLNITKEVDAVGQSANPDDTFKFTIKVTQKDEDDKALVDDPNTNDDDLWFSVYKGGYVDLGSRLESTAWTKFVNSDGETYYYAPNGTELVVNLKAGENLRFLNLVSNTDFSVVEGDLDNYVLDTITTNADKKEIDVDKQSIDGHIAKTETDYTVKFTNKYEKVDVPVKKVWLNDDNGSEGLRDEIDVQLYANGNKVEGDEGIGHLTSENTDSDGNWVYTFEDLDRYANGEQITYTVEELTDLTPHYTSVTTGDMATGFTITNTRENDDVYTSVSGTKTWEDNNNQDGIRPGSIQINLYKNGQTYVKSTTVTPADDGSWSYEFTGLPKYEGGQEIVYSVTETPVDFYTTTTGTTANDFINTHTTFKTKVVVDKDWEDNDNQDGLRGPITVKLSNHGLQPETKQLTLDNNWHVEWTDLERRDSGTDINYDVTEVQMPEGYEQYGDPEITTTVNSTTQEKTITIKFTNKHVPNKISVKGTKSWDDEENQDGIRPDSITLKLMKDDVATGDTCEATKDNDWTCSFDNLDEFENGQAIAYSVDEDESGLPEGYSKVGVTGDIENGFVITNKHETAVRNITVTKNWADNEDQDGVRPTSISVILKANGTQVGDAVTLNSKNSWTKTWEGLDTNAGGKEIKYTVEEDQTGLSDAGYSYVGTTGSMKDGFVITNKHETAKRSIKVTKKWEDAGNQDGYRPDSISVILKANGTQVGDAVTLNSDNSWAYTWKDLDTNAAGEEIKYTVEETTDISAHYSVEYSGSMDAGFVITNTHTPEVRDVTVVKEWIDDDPDNYRPTSVEVTLKANGETAQVSPATVTLNETNGWTYTWKNLDKKANGKDIEYTVTEKPVANYDTTVDVTDDGIVVVNTIQDLLKDIPVEKKWVDDNNRDGLREPITVTITGRVGNNVVVPARSITLSEGNNWKSAFTQLPTFYKAKLISYSIEEAVPEGYSAEYAGDSNEGYVITNTHTPVKIKITGTKVWNDQDNVDGARPESITITLFGNGKQVGDPKVVTVGNDGKWSFEFDDLYKCEGGQPIKYSITENAVGGYSSTIGDVTEDNTVTVTNTHTPETISYKITKSWDDLDNNDGVRPSSITVRLLADGVEKASQVLNDGNNWTYTFTNLPKYRTGSVGVLVQYTIIEDEVKGYSVDFTDIETTKETTSITNTITNIHKPETTEVTVTKTWADDNNKYMVRPSEITVRLYANGKQVRVATLSEANGWIYTFTGLLKYMNGEIVIYTISEDPVRNYKTVINGYDITNIYDGPHGKTEITPPNTFAGSTTNKDYSVLFFLILGLIGLVFKKESKLFD